MRARATLAVTVADKVFTCGEAERSSINKFSSSSSFQEDAKKLQNSPNLRCFFRVAYVVWAINFKSEVRSNLRGCLEAVVASKAVKRVHTI